MAKSKLLNRNKNTLIASEYVRIHNQACKEYKEAFAKVGARLWSNDNAHLISEANIPEIASNIKNTGVDILEMVRPLTVLDSYPNVNQADRKKLNLEVDSIFKKYQRMWEEYLSKQ